MQFNNNDENNRDGEDEEVKNTGREKHILILFHLEK